MAKFTPQQAADVAAIQQVINEWADELDINDGVTMDTVGVLTDDCRYNVAGAWREGAAAAAQNYKDRFARLTAEGGLPVMRHLNTNFRVYFTGEGQATCEFMLLFFIGMGTPPIKGGCDPVAVAEVTMKCRQDAEGDWRISEFDSCQTFQRA